MLRLLCPKHKDTKIIENHPNHVILVFIGKLSLSTLVPEFQSFLSFFLHHCVMAKLATNGIRVNTILAKAT